MGNESLGDIFYVSSKGQVYAPIPRDHSMIIYTARRHIFPLRPRPSASYQLSFLDDGQPIAPKIEAFEVCLGRDEAAALQMGFHLASRGKVTIGGLTFEAAEAKAEDIMTFARHSGQFIDFVLEKA